MAVTKELLEHVRAEFSGDLQQPVLGRLRCKSQEMLSPPRTAQMRHPPALCASDPTRWDYSSLRNHQRQLHSETILF